MDLAKIKNIACEAARAAGKIIQLASPADVAVEDKKDGGENPASQVVTAIDREAERKIVKHLLPSCKAYNLALLTEERPDDRSRFEKEFFWCIDPLDGTLPFTKNQVGYSVSIALVQKDGTPVVGVVYIPTSKCLYWAIKGQGAYKNERVLRANRKGNYLHYITDKALSETPRAVEIRSILKASVERYKLRGIRERSGGAAVYNAIIAIENGPALMMKFPKAEKGGGSVWDYAASACICREAGMKVSNYHGEPLDLNRKDSTFMNHEGIYYANLPGV